MDVFFGKRGGGSDQTNFIADFFYSERYISKPNNCIANLRNLTHIYEKSALNERGGGGSQRPYNIFDNSKIH